MSHESWINESRIIKDRLIINESLMEQYIYCCMEQYIYCCIVFYNNRYIVLLFYKTIEP